ncbi:hypothetical protein AVEN_148847-1, partial [Araneus ventricosus]
MIRLSAFHNLQKAISYLKKPKFNAFIPSSRL